MPSKPNSAFFAELKKMMEESGLSAKKLAFELKIAPSAMYRNIQKSRVSQKTHDLLVEKWPTLKGLYAAAWPKKKASKRGSKKAVPVPQKVPRTVQRGAKKTKAPQEGYKLSQFEVFAMLINVAHHKPSVEALEAALSVDMPLATVVRLVNAVRAGGVK